MNIRSAVFWLIDFLTGGKKRQYYNDIKKKYLDKNYCDDEDLKSILNYARKNVPCYSLVPNDCLESFPVVDKMFFKEKKELCFSLEYKKKEKLHKYQTSGSTGNPMIGYQDPDKRRRVVCDLIYSHSLVDWKLGNRYIFIRNWAENYKQSRIKIIAKNFVPISISHLNDEKIIWLVKYLKKHPKTVLFGYSSSIVRIKNYIIEKKINVSSIKLSTIVCDSDELPEGDRRELEKLFRCRVANRYDNEENGLIAISHYSGDSFHVNYPSLHVELLKLNSNEHVKPGEVGRIVITDLYSKAMPLIRYDTGDLAISDDKEGRIKEFKQLFGRKSCAFFTYDNRLVSSVALSAAMEVFQNMSRYQLLVCANYSYIFNYVGTLTLVEMNDLLKRLNSLLGKEAKIVINKVDVLKENNFTGKFETIVKG